MILECRPRVDGKTMIAADATRIAMGLPFLATRLGGAFQSCILDL